MKPIEETLAAAIGGTEMIANLHDGSTETVRVRELPIRDMPTYLMVSNDEAQSVELFCDRPKGWASRLTRASHEALVTEGERLNLDFLRRYAERQDARRLKLLTPGRAAQEARLEKAVLDQAVSRLGPGLQSLLPKPELTSEPPPPTA